jgi:hypothetical protein
VVRAGEDFCVTCDHNLRTETGKRPCLTEVMSRAFGRPATQTQTLPPICFDPLLVSYENPRKRSQFTLWLVGISGACLVACIVYLLVNPPWSAAGRLQPQFGLGASRQDVQAILGQPTSTGGQCWYYGKSEVCFQNDRVVSWYDSRETPLKLPAKAGE